MSASRRRNRGHLRCGSPDAGTAATSAAAPPLP